ncbi:hypothetical protein Tco_1231209 [Tanacetum coccineum]
MVKTGLVEAFDSLVPLDEHLATFRELVDLLSDPVLSKGVQPCLLHHLRLPTLPSTPTLSQAESSVTIRRYRWSSPRVIVLGYDGLPMQPVAPPSPDYIPGLEDPQTPPVPQDEDECEPMFIQPHDPDYVPEPIYPEYIPLEDEHKFLSDLEEDPEEYEDDETEDGPVNYPMDGGEDGDDDEGDSSGDDADDVDEDKEDEDKGMRRRRST